MNKHISIPISLDKEELVTLLSDRIFPNKTHAQAIGLWDVDTHPVIAVLEISQKAYVQIAAFNTGFVSYAFCVNSKHATPKTGNMRELAKEILAHQAQVNEKQLAAAKLDMSIVREAQDACENGRFGEYSPNLLGSPLSGVTFGEREDIVVLANAMNEFGQISGPDFVDLIIGKHGPDVSYNIAGAILLCYMKRDDCRVIVDGVALIRGGGVKFGWGWCSTPGQDIRLSSVLAEATGLDSPDRTVSNLAFIQHIQDCIDLNTL